ncbi:MAG TPA: chemotaxis protein CheA [Pyrinomonadaceae bacterium]|nr:chemotaxis protein CheA [Pyrinomonadaceae bacterium]
MADETSDNFFNEFLDDYFAESDEHLTIVRSRLLAIEQFVGRASVDSAHLDELFRSFHTLKGISAMVGLTPAEQLAHKMESYLGALREGRLILLREGFEALIEGTRTLEQVILAHRNNETSPDITKSADIIEALTSAPSQQDSPVEIKSTERASNKDRRTKREWRFVFVPGPAHAAAGVNVNSVRARLQNIGEIIRSTPLIQEGDIAFEFIVLSDVDESELLDLGESGVTFSALAEVPYETESETSPETTETSAVPASLSAAPTSVRVDLMRLDQLMLLVSDLVVSRARLETKLKTLRTSISANDWRGLQEVSHALGKQLRDLRNGVMRVRMVPIGEIFERMRFVVRDLARETGKTVALDISGADTEIDKFLVERLMDPLLHIVRNAISHGLEGEAERVAAGKPPEGHVRLRAQTAGEVVVIEISDDGRGIDVDEIAARNPDIQLFDAGGQVDLPQLLKIISTPGFSTRDQVDRASGRGVGMDVVHQSISELEGSVSLETTRGEGTFFRISLPLTLAITDALIASVGGQMFALQQSAVQEVVEIDPKSIKIMENNEIVLYRNRVLPLVHLSNIFGYERKETGTLYAFVVGTGARATALVVDKVLGLREVVVRSLTDPLLDVKGISGATELGDGRPILILDALELLSGRAG